MEMLVGQVNFRGSLPRSSNNASEPMLHPDHFSNTYTPNVISIKESIQNNQFSKEICINGKSQSTKPRTHTNPLNSFILLTSHPPVCFSLIRGLAVDPPGRLLPCRAWSKATGRPARKMPLHPSSQIEMPGKAGCTQRQAAPRAPTGCVRGLICSPLKDTRTPPTNS